MVIPARNIPFRPKVRLNKIVFFFYIPFFARKINFPINAQEPLTGNNNHSSRRERLTKRETAKKMVETVSFCVRVRGEKANEPQTF